MLTSLVFDRWNKRQCLSGPELPVKEARRIM